MKNNKIIPSLISIIFVFIILFGINTGMSMHSDSAMKGCIFDPSATCPMSITSHVARWHQSFVVMSETINPSFFSSLILLSSILLVTVFSKKVPDRHFEFNVHAKSGKELVYIPMLFDHILQALSKGRLNPKVYSLARVNS